MQQAPQNVGAEGKEAPPPDALAGVVTDAIRSYYTMRQSPRLIQGPGRKTGLTTTALVLRSYCTHRRELETEPVFPKQHPETEVEVLSDGQFYTIVGLLLFIIWGGYINNKIARGEE